MVADVSRSTVHGVRIATVTPERPHGTCVVAMGFGAWHDAFELQRFTRLAGLLGVRLVVLETPGLGYEGTALTRRERAALLSGRYSRLGARMMAAATSATGPGEPVHLLGYSLGTSVAAAMAASRHAPRISSLVLVEPVAARTWNPLVLARSVAEEDAVIDDYLDETAGVPDAVAPSDRVDGAPSPARNQLDQLLLGTALSWGRLAGDLGRFASRQPAPDVLVVHGSASVLSPPATNAALVRWLATLGCRVSDVEMEGSHGIWQSLPRVDVLGGHVRSFWDAL
jgi:pimeloyl-ACP methyl ester carboxylesterase